MGQRQVVGDAEPERQPFVLAVLAQHAHALRPSGRAATPAPVYIADPDAAAAHRLEAEQRPQQPGAAGADQPGDAEDLAAMQREASRRQAAARSSSSSASPGSRGVRGIEVVDRRGRPSARRSSSRRRSAVVAAARVAAVAQHDEPVGDRLHLLDEVRDVDDRDAPAPRAAGSARTAARTSRVAEAAGRLVEHERRGQPTGERAGDLDELLRRRREVRDRSRPGGSRG